MRLIDIIREREQARIGKEMGPTRWRDVTQEDMNAFGISTHDPDPMHVDPEWAAKNSPFGGTIAFGFWTLSMITAFQHEMAGGIDGGGYEGVDDVAMIGINYGCDRLRFIEPVQIGSRIRARGQVVEIDKVGPDRLRRTIDLVVEIEGKERPALSTRWLSMILIPETDVTLQGFRRDGTA
ncbi:MaoC/PaaZ C-terminal domain-containing protein [Sphingosinicella soli]|uniref:Acyl dehydratase n=1 Tax=Sphingosinicella soli TaxID=333708 RepID=A0A7W7B3K1_9SPHN|nr:acyl dehydratase [Sphingosinicella soli]